MNLEEVKDLKDKIYEIEGLLELAQMREDKIPELEPLIKARIAVLNDMIKVNSGAEELSVEHEEMSAPVVDEVIKEIEEPEVTEDVRSDTEQEEAEEADVEVDDLGEELVETDEIENIDVNAASFEDAENSGEIIEYEMPEEDADDKDEEYADIKNDKEEDVKIPAKEDGILSELFEEDENTSVSIDPADVEIPVMSISGIHKPEENRVYDEHDIEDVPLDKNTVKSEYREHSFSSAKPAFTLNDRFRFRRELFGNSDAEYTAAMDLIATMSDYKEAEEYFLDELDWSMENPEVHDFMDILKKYFG